MGEGRGLPGILSPYEQGSSNGEGSNVVEARNTGVLPYQRLADMIGGRGFNGLGSVVDLEPNQIQPASIDLRLGRNAYRVRASFLPGPSATVMDKVRQLDGLPPY
jgi:dCTP deaminase